MWKGKKLKRWKLNLEMTSSTNLTLFDQIVLRFRLWALGLLRKYAQLSI